MLGRGKSRSGLWGENSWLYRETNSDPSVSRPAENRCTHCVIPATSYSYNTYHANFSFQVNIMTDGILKSRWFWICGSLVNKLCNWIHVCTLRLIRRPNILLLYVFMYVNLIPRCVTRSVDISGVKWGLIARAGCMQDCISLSIV